MPLTREEALGLLDHSRSPQRRRGAKRLRDLADPSTAAAVRRALATEVLDHRTWETQFQLVLALGATGTAEDLPTLQDLVHQPRDASMVNCALGYAIVQLGWVHRQDAELITWCHQQQLTPATPQLRERFGQQGEDAWMPLLDEGARGAVLDLRIVPPAAVMKVLLERASTLLDNPERPEDEIGIYVVMAAAAWPGDEVRSFLDRYRADPRETVAAAARRSLEGTPSRSFVYQV